MRFRIIRFSCLLSTALRNKELRQHWKVFKSFSCLLSTALRNFGKTTPLNFPGRFSCLLSTALRNDHTLCWILLEICFSCLLSTALRNILSNNDFLVEALVSVASYLRLFGTKAFWTGFKLIVFQLPLIYGSSEQNCRGAQLFGIQVSVASYLRLFGTMPTMSMPTMSMRFSCLLSTALRNTYSTHIMEIESFQLPLIYGSSEHTQ